MKYIFFIILLSIVNFSYFIDSKLFIKYSLEEYKLKEPVENAIHNALNDLTLISFINFIIAIIFIIILMNKKKKL